MKPQRTYIFRGNYGDRQSEANFIKDAMKNFDKETLTGVGAVVNNNIYSLQLIIYFALEKDFDKFELFVKERYSAFYRLYKVFIGDFLAAAANKGYNIFTFTDWFPPELFLNDEGNNPLIFWPSKKAMDAKWQPNAIIPDHTAFISYKSVDVEIAQNVLSLLSSNEVSAWFAPNEILAGDSIITKIEEGLSKAICGILIMTESFINDVGRWTRMEKAYFITLIGRGESVAIIPVLVGVKPSALPPLLTDTQAVIHGGPNWENYLLRSIEQVIQRRA